MLVTFLVDPGALRVLVFHLFKRDSVSGLHDAGGPFRSLLRYLPGPELVVLRPEKRRGEVLGAVIEMTNVILLQRLRAF